MPITFQVAEKIRCDERVSVIDRTNLRYLSELPQKVDLVTLDLSFISLLLVNFSFATLSLPLSSCNTHFISFVDYPCAFSQWITKVDTKF